MPPASNEEQFKFLISCIRYSNNGKVDFSQVAQECKIVSKGAAAKRYERMMRAHGIASNAASVKPSPFRPVKNDRPEPPADRPSKKRKGDAFLEDNGATDDDETFSSHIKPEMSDSKDKKFKIKEEAGQQLSMSDATSLMQFYDPNPIFDDEKVFNGSLGGSDYSGGTSSYAAPMSGYSGVQQGYNYGYGAGQAPGLQYQQPLMPFKSEAHGRSDSPVIVE